MKLALATLAFTIIPALAHAQDSTPTPAAPVKKEPAPTPRISRDACYNNPADCHTETLYLTNVGGQNDANEILVALRNLLDPSIKIFLVASQNAIIIQATTEQLQLAHKIIHDLDRVKKTYRITYTITDFDGDRRVGSQHFTIFLDDGQRTTFKQGSKVPVATGSYDSGKSSAQTQFTYLDVGMNIDTTLTSYATGVRLKSKIEQSSVAPEAATIAGVSEPIIRQTVIDGVADITPGKPVILGSIDITGSTHHLDIAASVETLP